MTIQRKIILEALKANKEHPSADALYDIVREKLPRISLGTVYRNLDLLSRQGIINQLEGLDGQKRFDYRTEPHPHFCCELCGKIEDVPWSMELPGLDPENSWVKRREVHGVSLLFQGLCSGCVKSKYREGGN